MERERFRQPDMFQPGEEGEDNPAKEDENTRLEEQYIASKVQPLGSVPNAIARRKENEKRIKEAREVAKKAGESADKFDKSVLKKKLKGDLRWSADNFKK